LAQLKFRLQKKNFSSFVLLMAAAVAVAVAVAVETRIAVLSAPTTTSLSH
jgi:hypothetical protein